MTIKEVCDRYGLTQTALAKRFGIPLRTVQGWHIGERKPPAYLPAMMIEILDNEIKKSPEGG